MWLLVNSGLYDQHQTKRDNPRMKKQKSILSSAVFQSVLLCLILMTALSGCGYSLTGLQPSILGNGNKTIKFKGVENPTLYLWLPSDIRDLVRDEIGSRCMARWVDTGDADWEIKIIVHRFELSGHGYARSGASLLYDGNMTMSAELYNGKSNTVAWSSGPISKSQVYEVPDEQSAVRELSKDLVYQLVDRMRIEF